MKFIVNCLKGVAIGSGAILPGISSGVFCVIFGIYEKLLDSILNFFKDIKNNLKFLFPILIGCGIGVILFGNVLNYCLYQFPIQSKSLFIGLILGSIPALLKESTASRSLKPSEKNATITEKLKMNGIINKDKKVIDLLGSDDLGDYVAVTTRGNLNEEKLFGMDNLELLFENIKETLKRIGDSVISGDIKVNPLGERIDACAYCKFNSICKFDSKIDKKRKPLNYKNSEVFKMLEGDNNA